MKARVAVLASGGGTTAEAFIRSEVAGDGAADTVLVISSRQDAGVLKRIARLNTELGLDIRTMIINSKTHPAAADELVPPGHQTMAEQAAIISALQAADIELVILLGYMKLVGPAVIEAYEGRILNTHPGLLPATKGTYGVHASETVLAYGLPEAGQTLHLVTAAYDEGTVIAENKVTVLPGDSAQDIFDRIQQTEKAHIAADVDAFIRSRR